MKRSEIVYDFCIKILNLKKALGIRFLYKTTIKKEFLRKLNYKLNLKDPKTFNEKMQWLKVYYHHPLMTICSDKYLVRDYVEKCIGKEYLNEIYGVYNSINEIDLEKLPNKFVLKANNSSGRVIICSDKSIYDWKKANKQMKKWFKENYFFESGEWVYKNIQPKIISEKYLGKQIDDYKIYCFNGEPRFTQVISNRDGKSYEMSYYDLEWNKLNIDRNDRPIAEKVREKPLNYEKMLTLSKNLANSFPFVRVDFYNIDNKLYFGELTFFPMSGMLKFDSEKFDYLWGDLLVLPNKIKRRKYEQYSN